MFFLFCMNILNTLLVFWRIITFIILFSIILGFRLNLSSYENNLNVLDFFFCYDRNDWPSLSIEERNDFWEKFPNSKRFMGTTVRCFTDKKSYDSYSIFMISFVVIEEIILIINYYFSSKIENRDLKFYGVEKKQRYEIISRQRNILKIFAECNFFVIIISIFNFIYRKNPTNVIVLIFCVQFLQDFLLVIYFLIST